LVGIDRSERREALRREKEKEEEGAELRVKIIGDSHFALHY